MRVGAVMSAVMSTVMGALTGLVANLPGAQELTAHDGGSIGGGDDSRKLLRGLGGARRLVGLGPLEVVEERHINGLEGIA